MELVINQLHLSPNDHVKVCAHICVGVCLKMYMCMSLCVVCIWGEDRVVQPPCGDSWVRGHDLANNK